MENENVSNEIDNDIFENTTEIIEDNSMVIDKLNIIHEDLGLICSFIIFFVVVLLCHYAYKFFNMFFVI